MRIQSRTRLLAVVGDPVAHSLSPRMHNAALAALGIDAVYVALRATAQGFEPLVRGLLSSGAGLNVSVPHKRRAAALADAPSDTVRRTGACNVLWPTVKGLAADNTDVGAVSAAARALVGAREVRRALVLGTGGSARAAAVGVAGAWPEVVIAVRSRDAGRAQEFLAWGAAAGLRVEDDGGAGADLLVNATPLGLSAADPMPLDERALGRLGQPAVLDLVYVRGRTRLVQAARRLGLAAEDGRTVLVGQGAATFRLLCGVPAPVEVMRAGCEAGMRAFHGGALDLQGRGVADAAIPDRR